MRKILLIAAVAALCAPCALALDLTVTKKDGKVVKVEKLSEITFDGDAIKAVGGSTETVNYADLASFQFDRTGESGAAVADILASGVKYDGATIFLPGAGNVKVYNVAGAVCRQAAGVESVSVADLAAGVYAVEVATEAGTTVCKIYKK